MEFFICLLRLKPPVPPPTMSHLFFKPMVAHMNGITSFSSIQEAAARGASLPRVQQTKFDLNSKEYGPVVATALAAAGAIGDGASAVVSFSEKGLHELAQLPEDLYDGAASLAKGVASSVADAAESVADEVGDVAGDIAALSRKGLHEVEHLAQSALSVANGGMSTASKVSDAMVSAVDNVGSTAASVAGYTGLGVAAALQKFANLG